MGDTISGLLVPIYFVHAAIGAAVLAWWFMGRKDQQLRTFGLGVAGYAVGLSIWALLVLVKPDDLKPWVLAGALPFLLAHYAYAKVAYKKIGLSQASLLTLIVTATIIATFVVRTFLYPSDPYFSPEGLLFFGLQPLAVMFYIATIAMTFLPAIPKAVGVLKQGQLRNVLQVGLTVLFINSIILVSAKDAMLLIMNGVIMSTTLLVLWVSVLLDKKA